MDKNYTAAATRVTGIVLLIGALIYGLVLPFCWNNDPSDKYGTLSLLCENHIPFFWLWAVLTGLGLAVNLELLFYKYGYKGKVLHIAVAFALLGMLLTAATLNHSILNWNPKRILHWTGAVCYAVGLSVAFLLFFLIKIREYKRFAFFIVLIVCIIAGVAVQMITVGKNGYMEFVPMALLELTLLILNYTNAVPVKSEPEPASPSE